METEELYEFRLKEALKRPLWRNRMIRAKGVGDLVSREANAEAVRIQEAQETTTVSHPNPSHSNTMNLDVFISHSSHDKELAEALIDLVRLAVGVPADRIRCSSVNGYRLPGGAITDELLKKEVREATFFIGLLTPHSTGSAYVLFELGARWGAQLHLVPLVGRGTVASALRAPLSGLNALSCDDTAQLHQLLDEIAVAVGRSIGSAAHYEKQLTRVKALSASVATVSYRQTSDGGTAMADTVREQPLTASAKELLDAIVAEPDVQKRGLVEIRKEIEPGVTRFFPRIQYAGGAIGMKSRQFREAVSELVHSGWLLPPEENESTNTRTFEWSSSRPEAGSNQAERIELQSGAGEAVRGELTGPRTISSALAQTLARLDVGSDVRESIEDTLLPANFPFWMSISGRLVRNPVWNAMPQDKQQSLLAQYSLSGLRPPTVMHVDLLLIRRNTASGQGEIYTYSSDGWKTSLIPFRHRLGPEDRTQRDALNAQHIAKYWNVSSGVVRVDPLPGRYLISAKPNAEYGDLFIYVFEMCSVSFLIEGDAVRKKKRLVGPPWFDLNALRQNATSQSVNGDVIRALNELFTVNLGALRSSFPE